jgi:allophanate hydrolase subunit 2
MRGMARHGEVVVAHAGLADDRALRLADVIVQPPQPHPVAAVLLAVRTMRDLTGCTTVVVGVDGYGVLVFSRANRFVTSSTLRSSICE